MRCWGKVRGEFIQGKLLVVRDGEGLWLTVINDGQG